MDPTTINNEIVDFLRQRNILEVLREALLRNVTNKEILLSDYGITEEEINWFYSEIVGEKDVPISRLLPIIDKALLLINEKLREIFSSQLKGYKVIIFNKWHELVEAKWVGTYRGRKVARIEDSKVILLVTKELEKRGVDRKYYRTLVGPGIYYSRFYLENSRHSVNYYVPIQGLIMSKRVLEKAKRSTSLTHGRFSDHYKKYLITIMLDYNLYDPDEASLLKRLYTRIAYENRSVFELFLKAIRDEKVENIEDLSFLSVLPEAFNRIIISESKFESIESALRGGIPGILGYEGTLDKIERIIGTSLDEILITVKDARKRFIMFGWEIIKDFMPK